MKRTTILVAATAMLVVVTVAHAKSFLALQQRGRTAAVADTPMGVPGADASIADIFAPRAF